MSACQFVSLSVCQLVSLPAQSQRSPVAKNKPHFPQLRSWAISQLDNLAVCHVGSGARGQVVKRPAVSWSTFRLAGCQGVHWTVGRFVSAPGGSWPVVSWAGCRLSGCQVFGCQVSGCQFVSLSVCQVVNLYQSLLPPPRAPGGLVSK